MCQTASLLNRSAHIQRTNENEIDSTVGTGCVWVAPIAGSMATAKSFADYFCDDSATVLASQSVK
jgi:hypothetical protein